jgi:pilus assembly protein CpaE
MMQAHTIEEGMEDIVQAPSAVSIIQPLPRASIHVFCETNEIAELAQSLAEDRRLAKAHLKVQMGGAPAAVQAYKNAPTPNVIILETHGVRTQLIEMLDRLSTVCDPGTKLLIIGHLNDVVLYRELLRRGVSDYLIAPFQPLDLLRALSEIFHEPGNSPIGRTIAFIGARGGVGSSTIAHNVAWALSRSHDGETVIADLDLPFGTVGLDFNQDPPQTIADAIYNNDKIDAAVVDSLLSKCSDNLSILAAPASLMRAADLEENAFEPVIESLRQNVPSIVLDLPHAWNAWVRKTLINADRVVIVAEPDLACLRNTKNIVDMLREVRQHDDPPCVVLNKVAMPKRPEITVEHFVRAIQMQPLQMIAFDAGIFGLSSNNGQMLAEIDPKNKAVQQFLEIARVVTGQQSLDMRKRTSIMPSVLNQILGRLGQKN